MTECCLYNQVLKYSTPRGARPRTRLFGDGETFHRKVESVNKDIGIIGVGGSVKEYLGTRAGRNSPPHVCRQEGQPNLVGGYTRTVSVSSSRRMLVYSQFIHPKPSRGTISKSSP